MKILVTITLTYLTAFNFSAQNPDGWIEAGAEWYFGTSAFQATGYIEAKYVGIENINGIDFQKVSALEQWALPASGGGTNLTPMENLTDLFYFTSNDSVFLRKADGSLQFIWHQNPQVGDVWDFGIQTDFQGENPLSAFALVTLVEEIQIAGKTAKRIQTTPCLDLQGTLPQPEDFYYTSPFLSDFNTLFGPTDFPKLGLFVYSQETTIVEYPGTELLCYLSASTDLFHINGVSNCYNGVILSNGKMEVPFEVTIYPNPASNILHIHPADQVKSVEILDMQGRVVLKETLNPAPIDMLESGSYWVKIETEKGDLCLKKLIVH